MDVTDAAPAHSSTLIGRVLNGRYRLIGVVGNGGMATVFRAEDVRLGRCVAAKVLHSHLSSDAEFVARFKREAEAAAGLSAHPNIVSVYDVGDEDGLQYLVMELVEGPNLKDIIRTEAPLSVTRAFNIGAQVASALEFAHKQGIIHRDIKPQNILMGNDGVVKVGDFGIARSADATQMTRAGTVLGSAHYLAPEQAYGNTTPASDVYSLGVVIFEMLTGQLPFEAEGPIAVALKHVNEPSPPPSAFNPRLPSAVDAIVLRAMSKQPADRYRSAGELGSALLSPSAQQQAPGPAASPPRRPTRTVVGAAAPAPHRSHGSFWALPLVFLAVFAAAAFAGWAVYTVATQTASPGHHPGSHRSSRRTGSHVGTPTPTGQSNQVVSGATTVRLTYIFVDPAAVRPGQSTSLRYTISRSGPSHLRARLIATLTGDQNGQTLGDSGDASTVTLGAGSHQYFRSFVVPASAKPQSYAITVTVQSPDGSQTYGSIHLDHLITVLTPQGALPNPSTTTSPVGTSNGTPPLQPGHGHKAKRQTPPLRPGKGRGHDRNFSQGD